MADSANSPQPFRTKKYIENRIYFAQCDGRWETARQLFKQWNEVYEQSGSSQQKITFQPSQAPKPQNTK